MKSINICIAGLGNVGSALVELIEKNSEFIKYKSELKINIIGLSARNKNKKRNLKFLFSFLIVLSLLIRISVNNIIFNENTLFQSNLSNFLSSDLNLNMIFTKIYYILYYIINSFFKYPIWLFNSFGLLLSLYFLKNIKVLKVFLIFFILNFLFIFLIYFTTSANIVWYLSASLDRLVLQTSGFYFVIFSLFNNRIIKF